MTSKRIHLVCNAHLDPVWMWTWEDGMAEAVSTFRIAADFCDENPGFVFNHNEAVLYRWVEKLEPGLFKRIRKLVKRGRWHIGGGAFLQPDLNIPAGETHIRNIMMGLDFFDDRFGVRPTVAYNFDPFGQPEGFAQILKGCGMEGYIFCRPSPEEWELPIGAFRWRDRSGAEIVARRSDDHYLTNGRIGEKLDKYLDRFETEGETLILWGVGNHGGGVTRREYAELMEYASRHPEYEFVHSTPERFFATVPSRGRLPIVHGEMQNCFLGCYTSMSRVKREFRRAEAMLGVAERLSTLTWWLGLAAYPREELDKAWRDVIFCAFHDILPGSGSPEVERHSIRVLHHAQEILDRLISHTFAATVAGEPPAPDGQVPVFVFNPHPFSVSRQVEFEYTTAHVGPPEGCAEITIEDENGGRVPHQRIRSTSVCAADWRARVVVNLDMEPFQVRRLNANLKVRRKPRPEKPAYSPPGRMLKLRTKSRLVCINLKTGLIDEISSKRGEKSWVGKGAFKPLLFKDQDGSWRCGDPGNESWIKDQYWTGPSAEMKLADREEAAHITADPRGTGASTGPVRIVEEGHLQTVVEAVFACGRSYLIRRYIIGKKDDLIRIRDRVFWAHKDHMLKLDVPLGFDLEDAAAETTYGAVSRKPSRNYVDRPNQRWVAARGQGRYLAVLNDGSYAHNALRKSICLNLVRSPAHASFRMVTHGPKQVGRAVPRHDQGEHEFVFDIICGARFDESEISKAAATLNAPPLAQVYYPGPEKPGKCVLRESPLDCSARNVLIEVLKRSRKGKGLTVRLRELEGRKTRAALRIGSDRLSFSIGAYELKTVIVRKGKDGLRIQETNLVEGL